MKQVSGCSDDAQRRCRSAPRKFLTTTGARAWKELFLSSDNRHKPALSRCEPPCFSISSPYGTPCTGHSASLYLDFRCVWRNDNTNDRPAKLLKAKDLLCSSSAVFRINRNKSTALRLLFKRQTTENKRDLSGGLRSIWPRVISVACCGCNRHEKVLFRPFSLGFGMFFREFPFLSVLYRKNSVFGHF